MRVIPKRLAFTIGETGKKMMRVIPDWLSLTICKTAKNVVIHP